MAGTQAQLGIAEQSSWGNVHQAATKLLPLLTADISNNIHQIQNNTKLGSGIRRLAADGVIDVAGTLTFELDHANINLLYELTLGAGSNPYTVADSFDKIVSIEVELETERHRIASAMFTGIEVSSSGGDDAPAQLQVTFIGRDLEYSATAFPSLSNASYPKVLHQDLTFRIGDLVDALDSGDDVEIENLTLSWNRPVDTTFVSGSRNMIQPVVDGFREASLAITLPRIDANATAIRAFYIAGTKLQATLNYDDGSNSTLIELATIKGSEGFDIPVSGPEKLTMEGTFEIGYNENSNMAFTNEIQITTA